MPLVYNEEKGVWEFGEDPKFKTKSEAQAYSNNRQSSLQDSIRRSMGVGPSDLQNLARESGTKKALEEQGYDYDEMFEATPYTPGGTSGGYEAPELKGEEAAAYQKASEELGYRPGVYSDTQDLLAEDQGNVRQIVNGTVKLAGKTATNVAGSIIGTAYGIGSAIVNGSFSSFYDNDFQRALDEANAAMDEYLPNYVRKEVEDYSLLEQMGTTNFWANDFLGGMSFVAGAVISEYLTAGLASSMIIPRAAKTLKFVDKAEDVAKGYQAAAFGRNIGLGVTDKTLKNLGNFARQTAVGSFYEAGVEARHFVDEAKKNYISEMQQKEGRDPFAEELSAFMDNAHIVGNSLFAANAALVSLNNIVTLPNSFGPGLTKRFGKGASQDVANKSAFNKGIFGTKEANVIPTKSLSAKELKTAAANLKVSVDDVKAMTVINKKALRSTSKLGKTLNGLRTTGKILEQGFAEGVWEEGMQGALSGGALEYVTNFYDPEAKDNNLSVMSAFASGLHEAYGTKEGLKEIVIGAILGLTGFAGPGGWQGGIYGTIKEEKQKQNQIDKLVETVNQSKDFGSIFKGMYLAGQQRLVATKKMDKAAELNDMFKYKNAENDAFMGYVLGRTEAGMYDSIEEDLVNTVNKMSNEEFAQEFGYENMTNDEITKRKNEAVVETKARAKQIRDGLLTAKNITNSEDVALNHGLAWTISTLDNIDRREASLGELVSTYAGRSIRNEDLKNYIQIGVALDDTKAIKEYTRIIGEINKKNLQKADGTFSQMWMGRETTLIGDRVKIDRLDKEIAELQKQKRELAKEMLGILKKGSSLTYNNDVDAFGQDLDIFLDTKDQINLQAKRPTFAERAGTPQDPRKVYEDLKKLAKYREQVITEYNFFLSKEGRKDFVSTINNINKLADRERLFEEFAIAASVTPITSDTKVREIQEAAFRIRGNSFITQAIKEEKAAEMVPADNTLANLNSRVQKSDASEQFKSWMADFKKGHDELLKTDQIKELLNFCKTKLAEAKKFANSFEGTQEGDNFKEFLDTNALQNRIKEIEDFLKAQGVPVTKSTGGFVPIIEKSSQLHTVKPDTKSKEAMEILKSLTAADVKNFKDVTIELVTDSEGGKIVNPQDAEGNEVEQGVKIRKGYNNKQQQLAVKYKGTIIGYIYDPNRYQFDDGAGGLRNFNKTAADLEKLNPAFVQMENGVMVPSALGDDFINTYNALTSFWTIADKAFESNLTLPSDLLDKFLFLNHSVKYLSNASESLDSISSNPNLQIKDPKGNSTRPIIFRQNGQNIFVYNEDTKNYELVSPDDYEYYYNNYIVTSKNNINNLSNQYVIVGNPEADVHVIGLSYTEVPVTESIVENIQDTYGAFKEDVERKVKEGAKTENDLDIFPVNAGFIAAKNAAGVRISLSFSKFQSTQETKEGKIIPKPNLVVQLYTRANRNAGQGGTYFNLYRDKENNKPVSSIRLVEGVGLFFKDKDKTNTSTRINNNEELAKALTIAISDRLEAYGEEGLEITAFQQMPEIREENNEGKNVVVGLETDKLNVRVDLMSSLSFRPKGITPASSASAPSKPKGNADSELAKKIIAEIDKINTTTADDQEVAKELLDAIEKAVKGQPTVSALIATKVGALKAYINKVFAASVGKTTTKQSPLSSVEATAKALEGINENEIKQAIYPNSLGYMSNQSISEAYHKAKADNSNSKLVEAVEKLLGKQSSVSNILGKPEILLSGLSDGFKAVSYKSFDVRAIPEVMSEIRNQNSFAKIIDYKGKKYVIVGLTLETARPATTVGRDNYSFAIAEFNNTTPKNIVEILENEAKENFGNIYTNFKKKDGIKKITTKDTQLTVLENTATSSASTLTPSSFQSETELQEAYNDRAAKEEEADKRRAEIKNEAGTGWRKALGTDPQLQAIIKDIENLTKKIQELEATGPAFKIEENPDGELIDFEQAFINLSRILPTNVISFKELDTIRRNLKRKGQTSGAFFNKIVYLARNASKGTEYHEAFHAVVRTFLTAPQLNLLYKEAAIRYGKPTKEQLTSLKNKAGDYQNLTARQLELLWYEEQMADEFQSYAVKRDKEYKGVKGIIKMIFDKIKRFAQWVTNSKADIDVLFNNIYEGQFKTAKEVNDFPLFFGRDIEVYKLLPKKFGIGYLDATTSLIAYNRVVKEVLRMKDEGGLITDDKVQDALESVINRYYDIESDDLIYGEILDRPSTNQDAVLKTVAKLEEIKAGLDGLFERPKDLAQFIYEVKRRASSIKFEENLDEEEYVEDDTAADLGIKDNRTLGGLGSTTKQMREYMALMEMPIDEFNLGLTKEELSSGAFTTYINPQELYTSVEAIMTNTWRPDMLKKLFYHSQDNIKIYHFYNNLAKDIKSELGRPELSNEELANLPISELFKSNKFNLFISNFNKYKANQITVLADPRNGLFKVFRTNMYDVQEKQIETWSKNWRTNGFNDNPGEAKAILETLQKSLKSYTKLLNPNTAEEYVNQIQAAFDALGINLAKNYIRYSLSYANIVATNEYANAYNRADKPTAEYLDKLKDNFELFSGVEVFDEATVQGIIESLKSGSPFLVDSTVNAFDEADNLEQVKDANTAVSGAVGRLKTMALGNSYFDETVGSTTVQNADGENQYTHLAPNFFLIQTLFYQNPQLRQWVFTEDREEGLQQLRDAFNAMERNVTDYQLESFYDAVKGNPMLNAMITGEGSTSFPADRQKTANRVFQNFKVEFNDGLRRKYLDTVESADRKTAVVAQNYRESNGNVFFDLDTRATVYTMMAYFASDTGNTKQTTVNIPGQGEVRVTPFIPLQIEAKNTQIAVMMPVNKLADNNYELNSSGQKMLVQHFMQEYNRISKISKEIAEDTERDRVDEYNIKMTDRGVDFFNFKKLSKTNPSLYNTLLNAARAGEALPISEAQLQDELKKFFTSEYNEFKELLGEENLTYTDKEGNTRVNILPNYYKTSDSTLNESSTAEFFYNSYINSLNYNNLMFGDLAYNFKNPIDFVKRMAGPNAAGPSIGYGETNVAILEDVYNENGTETTNAQAYTYPFWYTDTYLQSLGKNSTAVKQIWDRITKGYPLSAAEVAKLKEEGAMANPRKLTTFDLFLYGKKSVKVLIRSEASNFKGGEKARKYVDTLYDRIKRLDRNTDEYREIVREIQSYWVAKPGRENLHSKLNKLELQNIGLAIHASGVKGAKTNVNEIDAAEYSTLVVNNQFIREQVATNSIKDKIVHGTQLMQLISSEHADNTEVIFRGKNTDIGTLRRYYRELLGNRVLDSFMLMRDSIVDGDIAKYKYLLKSFEGSLIESGADPVLMEQFRAAYAQADMPEYNLNMPSVEQKFEAMFLSYMSKGVLSQKVPGHKLTLTSDEGYDVLRDKNGNVLPDNLPLDAVTAYQNDGAQFTKLRYHQKDNEKNVYYAECLISGQLLTELGLRPGDEIPSYMLELVGVRIPTQDKHSMVYLKVVGVLPAETGNQIVMPADILDLSGADFDIDSEFVRIPDFYRDENNNILIYGDYLKSEKPLITAFNEFVQSIKKQDKRVKQDIKDFELSDENYIKLIEERNALKLRLKSIKTDIQNNYDDIALAMNLEPTVEDEIEDFSNAEDVIANLKTVGIGLNQEQKNIITEIGDKNKQIKSAKKEIVAKVLEKNNHPSTQESFDYKYGKQVADNVKAFNEGKIDEIKPITVNEINNLTLDIEKSLIYNEGNSDVATSPADDKLAQDFMKKYFNAEGEDSSNKFDNPADIKTASSPTDILKANASNSIGKDNVGIAALWNVMYSYLRNYNIPLIKEVEKDNKTILNASGIDQDIIDIVTSPFNTDVTTDKSETRNRVRVVHINSTQITLAVDNAKFQYASFFNLSTDNLGSTLILTSKGLSFDRAMLLNIQPALLEYSKRAKVVSGQLKTEIEERVTKAGVIKDLLSEYASELKDIKPEKAGQVELTVENLYQAKLFGEGKSSTLEKWQYLEIQLKALEVFSITNEESSFLRDLGNVLSLIKGAKTDFVEMNGISESLKKLGIQLVLKKGAKGFDPNDYEIRHVSNFKDLAIPYDVLPILTQDGLVKTNLQVFAAIMRIAEDFVITQSKFALNTSERVKLSFKTKKSGNVLNYSDKAKTLKNHMIAFLASKAYAKKSGKKFTFDTLFAEPGNLTRLSELVREAYRNDELKKNHFIKYLTPERTSYEGKTDSTFFGKALQKFVGQTRTKKDATFKQQLSNAFTELQSGEFSDPNTKQIARELSGLLLEYLFVKDGLLFRNKSFISEIDPKHFKRVSESLFDVQAVLSGKKSFQDIFGVDQATLEQEFVEKFARYQGNAFDLISNSYVNIVGNMRKNKIDQLKEAAKATGLDEELLEGQSASEIVKILQTLQESEALDSINKNIMPLTIDKETGVLTVNLFAGTKKKDIGFDSLDSNNTPVIKSNFQALLSTGLFVPMKGMINGKSQNRIGFPEFISITYKGGGKQIYKLIKTEKTKKDKELKGVSAPYDFGFGATYMPVSTLGTQEVLPYAIDLDEHARMEGEAELLRMSKSSSKAAETSEQKPADKKSLFNFSRESTKEEPKNLPAEPPTITSFNPLSSNPIAGIQPKLSRLERVGTDSSQMLSKIDKNIRFDMDESDDIPC